MNINSIMGIMPGRSRYIAHGASSAERQRKCEKERDNLKQNNYDNINTSIKSNPDARVSFKGTPLLYKAANFSSNNPLLAEACFTLPIVCALRPSVIMATARNKEDKTKCQYQAAKSVTSGIAALGMTALVGTQLAAAVTKSKNAGDFKIPEKMKETALDAVSKGIDVLKNILGKTSDAKLSEQIEKVLTSKKKIEKGKKSKKADLPELNLSVFDEKGDNTLKNFKEKLQGQMSAEDFKTVESAIKEQVVLNNYEDTAKNVADKFFQPIYMPVRAGITIAAIPSTLRLLGFKKPQSGKEVKKDIPCPLKNCAFNDEKSNVLFQPFAGVTKYANK